MATEFDFAEGALSDGLAQDVLADFAFVRRQLDLSCLFSSLDTDLIRVADGLIHGCSWSGFRLSLC